MKTPVFAIGCFLICLIILIVGCATHSLNSSIFGSEKLAVDLASQATHDFNTLYPITNTTPSVVMTRSNLYHADVELSVSLKILDSLRLSYVTNQDPTNAAVILAQLQAVQDASTNIVILVRDFKQ